MKNEKCLYALMYNGKVAVYAEESKDDSVKLYKLIPNHEFKFICTLTNNSSGNIIDILCMKSFGHAQFTVRDECNGVIGCADFLHQNKVVEITFNTWELCPKIIRYNSITILENCEDVEKEDIIEVVDTDVCKILCKRHGKIVGYEMIDDESGIEIHFGNEFSGHIKVVPTIVDGRRLVGFESSKYGNKFKTRVVVDHGGHEWLQVIEYPRYKGDHGYIIFYDMDKIGDKNVNISELSRSEKTRIASNAISFLYDETEVQYTKGTFKLYDGERYAGKIRLTKDSVHLKCSGLKREGMENEKLEIEITQNEISEDAVYRLIDVMGKEITKHSFEIHKPDIVLGYSSHYVMHISLNWKNELLCIHIEEPDGKIYTIDISRVERG